MPRYRIRLINSEFDSADESDFPSLEAARKSAVHTATKVVSEAVADGEYLVAADDELADLTAPNAPGQPPVHEVATDGRDGHHAYREREELTPWRDDATG